MFLNGSEVYINGAEVVKVLHGPSTRESLVEIRESKMSKRRHKWAIDFVTPGRYVGS